MEDFKISVLITFYNQEKYVDDCLNSVFSQKTNFPFKVLVGDDGSTDGTLEKIRMWQKKHPDRLFVFMMPREEDVEYVRGARASRNRLALLQKVDTKYFHYLDGDDYWTDSDKLQIQYDILEEADNSDCVACAHSIGVYREGVKSQERQCWGSEIKRGKYALDTYWRSMYFSTDTILFRSESISKLPLGLITDSFNDNLITFCFMQFGTVYFVDRCMADYRQNDTGIWVSESKAIGIIRELMMYDIELKINPHIRVAANHRHIRNFIYIHTKWIKTDELEQYYAIAKKYDLPVTKRVLESRCVFVKNRILDKAIIVWCAIECIIVSKWMKINEIRKK